MRRVKQTAVIVIPKQPYIDWANSLEEGRVKLGEEFTPEHTIYLVEDVTGYMIDKVEIIKPYFEFIFEEELNSWHRLVSNWPANCDLATFLDWFEVEIHSLVLDLHGGGSKQNDISLGQSIYKHDDFLRFTSLFQQYSTAILIKMFLVNIFG